MTVTLSIGIGLNAATYLQNYEYCRIAIEMALGRARGSGRDQKWRQHHIFWRKSPADGKNNPRKGPCKGPGSERVYEYERTCGSHGT